MSENNQAISGLDFVSQKAIAVLQENVTRVAVSIVIKQVKKSFRVYKKKMYMTLYLKILNEGRAG